MAKFNLKKLKGLGMIQSKNGKFSYASNTLRIDSLRPETDNDSIKLNNYLD